MGATLYNISHLLLCCHSKIFAKRNIIHVLILIVYYRSSSTLFGMIQDAFWGLECLVTTRAIKSIIGAGNCLFAAIMMKCNDNLFLMNLSIVFISLGTGGKGLLARRALE
jgi:hypothetical protein